MREERVRGGRATWTQRSLVEAEDEEKHDKLDQALHLRPVQPASGEHEDERVTVRSSSAATTKEGEEDHNIK